MTTFPLRPKANPAALLAFLYFCLLFLSLGKNRLLGLDESWYANVARAEVLDGHWFPLFFQGHIFWDKPPLIFWLQGLSLMVGGMNETAVRVWSALAGGLSIYGVYRLGAFFAKDEKAGFLCALALMLEPHFILSSRIATLDMPLLACLFGFWWQWTQAFDPNASTPRKHLLAAGLWSAAAIGVKSWSGLIFLPAVLAALFLKKPKTFDKQTLLTRFFLPIALTFLAWFSFYAAIFGKNYFAWEWRFNLTQRIEDGGFSSTHTLVYALKFYAVILQEGLPFLWPLMPLGLALWTRESWAQWKEKRRFDLGMGLFFFVYYAILITFFMATLINYFLPLMAVGVLGLAFLVRFQPEPRARFAGALALLLALLNGWTGYRYMEWIFILSLLIGCLPFIPNLSQKTLKLYWVYGLSLLWLASLGYKAQDYLRHPPDPNRVWVAEVLAHPAQTKGQPLLFVGEETDARALEFYSDYKVKALDHFPPTRPTEALLFEVNHRAVFLPAPDSSSARRN